MEKFNTKSGNKRGKREISPSFVRYISPRERIVEEGDVLEWFFIILYGEVEILQNNKMIRFLKDGDIFGIGSALLGKPTTVTALARTQCRIAFYDNLHLRDILYFKPQMGEKIFSSIVRQLEQTTQMAEENIPFTSAVDLNEIVYDDDDVIIHEGTSETELYQLVSTEGGLLVTKEGKVVGRITQPGEYFGEMSSILNVPRTATVKSVGQSVVKVYSGKDIDEVIKMHPALARKIIKTLANRLMEADILISGMDGI